MKQKFDPNDLYIHNKSEFLKIYDSLDSFYCGYINRKKILILLDFWMYGFRAVLQEYGIEAAKQYSFDKNTFSTPEFSWIYEFNHDIRNGKKPIYSVYFFNILSIFVKRYSAPGTPIKTIFDKIRWRASKLIILSSPVNFSNHRKDDLIEILLSTFDHDKKDEIRICFEFGLPDLFYAEQNHVKNSKKSGVILDAAPTNFLDFNGIENILLFDSYVKLVGRQHGGGFGAYINEFSAMYEFELSDTFIGWGLCDVNEEQHRYKVKVLGTKKPDKKRIIWIERAKVPIFYKYVWPCTFEQGIDDEPIRTIYSVFQALDIKYFNLPYAGFFECSMYDGLRGLKLFNSGMGEKIIENNDILIFDNFFSSLIFYCVKNKITFICVTTNNDFSNFTKPTIEWFNLLHKYGFAFFSEEKKELELRLKELDDINATIPKAVTDFHYANFINI